VHTYIHTYIHTHTHKHTHTNTHTHKTCHSQSSKHSTALVTTLSGDAVPKYSACEGCWSNYQENVSLAPGSQERTGASAPSQGMNYCLRQV